MACAAGSGDAAAAAAAGPAADVIGSSEPLSERRRELNERLDERHRERLETQAQRRNERAAASVESEKVEHFWAALEREEAAARAELVLPLDADRARVGDALDAASRRLQTVHHFIADSSAFLPAFQLGRAQQRARQLQEHVQQRQNELVPPQRFGFRGRRAARAEPPAAAAPAPAAEEVPAPTDSAEQAECGFRDRSGARLTLGGGDVSGRDVTLTRLSRCAVRVMGAPATVHLSHLRDCRLLLGPVVSSVFLEDCRRCTLVVACQQLRAHSSADCDLYLHVTSRAVVEDCQRLRFAPYNLTGEDVDADWTTSGLSRDRNNWSEVDDFNWLSKAHKSPNWSILPEGDRVASWDGELEIPSAAGD